ncbi:unnamed protein product, partial [Prorocentrum cordatum]
ARAAFEEGDVDGSGDVGLSEFVAMTFDWKAVEVEALHTSLLSFLEGLDADGNGVVDVRELSATFEGLLDPGELAEVLGAIDHSGDGRVSLEELAAFLRR